ncbi:MULTISPECIES: phage tail sheath C-terminal domain-containing protein [unclassified Lysobacter]|uniref:phage tail sheath family protein n=1 Tax=unclassified Lysobacter TaxID=2635362 RepID=UPI001BEBD495|nr:MULTISPECIES: phage tail sheath C-terminal domain-containing protein [unclassified Lysobacter]MBT2748678.1 phage tail sheath family protein [Lysobacter sp. ISL-42]MBT2751613.1 phage tail sheath family protein [Lysobacter sp. ISL-50]MBT2775807.1 phage tail sheath family protein [Lysobacter sp. ISL-54]MBT2782228.1 phage tail sheath family protein [Lysobacter sp. ISL-52]
MALNLRTPGVYIVEESKFPPSVVPVETAIPAFFGYTRNAQYKGTNLLNRPVAVNSLLEFQEIFGLASEIGGFVIALDEDGNVATPVADPGQGANARFRLAYALRHFYDNGGGRCYIVSVGTYVASAVTSDIVNAHVAGLEALAREDEPTLIVFPDLSGMRPAAGANPAETAANLAATRAAYHSVLVQALNQCARLGDRFLVCDLWDGDQPGSDGITAFRNGIGTRNLKYGAAYHPYIRTTMAWNWDESTITVSQVARRNDDGTVTMPSPHNGMTLAALKTGSPNSNPLIYGNARNELARFAVTLPPAAAVVGIYATVDRTRGVWKSPANESLASVFDLSVRIDQDLNDNMNVEPSGKTINALRAFSGKGFLIWGARTLAGNDNEWRYVSVRRFFNMVEESTRKTTEAFVFEPNAAGTWAKVKAMIENFLIIQWRDGALAGAKPNDAFYVNVGLGSTMTAQDILEGRMNVEIGMAVVRPAEFVVLRFSHKMQES